MRAISNDIVLSKQTIVVPPYGYYVSLEIVTFTLFADDRGDRAARDGSDDDEEAINTSFCPLQERCHTFVLRGLRNISEAP